jgi:hypothetical protein
MASLADIVAARRARRRSLREELRPLEQDVATEEEQAAAYREALARERIGALADVARLRQLRPESRQQMPGDPLDREPPTGAERLARAERRVRDIDAELARVGG